MCGEATKFRFVVSFLFFFLLLQCSLSFRVFQWHPNLQLVKQSLIQKEHAAALDKGPNASGPNATEPAAQTFGVVDDLQPAED